MITDETMIEMAEAHFACSCQDCFDNYASLMEELYWEEREQGL